MSKTTILICHKLLQLLLISTFSVESCPLSCFCTTIERKGFIVNCSFKQLRDVPSLPQSTIRLYLQNNSLTTVPTGAFDHLRNLEEVDVSNNPWNCDCSILYLKHWLDSQRSARNAGNVRCATPEPASMRPFYNLTGNEMTGCRRPWPINCHQFFVRDLVLIALALVLLILMSCAVRMSKRLACRVTMNELSSRAQSTRNYESHKTQ
ncbi:hypothetical protein FKM82_004254 [Ascaphus truei]